MLEYDNKFVWLYDNLSFVDRKKTITVTRNFIDAISYVILTNGILYKLKEQYENLIIWNSETGAINKKDIDDNGGIENVFTIIIDNQKN
jgi:hypothetical protein